MDVGNEVGNLLLEKSELVLECIHGQGIILVV